MESIAMTLIGITVTPIGVVESNSRSRAVMELKIDELASSEPTNSSRKWPWSGATLTRFCDELAWGVGDCGLHPHVAGGGALTPNACTFGLPHNE